MPSFISGLAIINVKVHKLADMQGSPKMSVLFSPPSHAHSSVCRSLISLKTTEIQAAQLPGFKCFYVAWFTVDTRKIK